MSQPVGDLVIDLSLDAVRFDEQMSRVRRHFSGLETDARKTAGVVEQNLSRQALAAQKAGISVGQYKAAMRTLPAQFTDIATQLAGGQNPWLILLQQGGQVKDSFGGMIPMFRGLAGAITLPMVGVTSLAVATGALAYAWYQGNSTLSDFNKTLVLSGNQAGLTADRMLVLSRAGQAAGLTFNQTSESLSALVKAGVSGEAQIASISQSVARFSSVSGVEVDKVAEAFGKLTTDPTSGLTAMARQFHNVTAEQIAYVAQLQRSGDEAGALQAANEAATKGFDDQTRRLKENMGTLETWADRTARAFKSMWDAVLDIGRPDTAQEMLIKAEAAFKKADDIWSLRKDDYFVNDEARARYWDDREKARLALEAARKKAEQQSQQDKNAQQQSDTEASRLKYTEEAQKAYERLQTPLEKYTARQEELNKALKDGKILQADYNTLMAAAKKDYESTLKKPSAVKVSAGERQEDRAHAALLALETELRTLEKHSGANEKISQQRRDLWKAENQYAVLKEAATKRQLSEQEKSLLAHEKETLEYKRQLAELGDKVEHQKRLNELAQQAARFEQQQSAKQAAISAKARGLTDRQAQRESEEQRLRDVYGDNPDALAKATSALKNTWSAEEQLRGSWMAGLKSGWGEWAESATDSFSQVKSVATQTFDGIAQNMAAMLTGSEQNWRGFTRSVLSMLTEIFLKQAMVGIVGSIGSAIGGAVGGGASASGGTAIQAAAAKFHFATGGFTGTGDKYEPAGIVHRGEFVFTKEATSRIGVGNLYRLMRGYADGGYVGGAGSPAQMRRAEGINFNQNNHVVIQNDGTNGQAGPQLMKAVYDMARKGAQDEIQAQMRDGGVFSGGRR
ncbi:phage tail tape measure protein [Escherichia coli]|uniref:phage tail tape measure protein n=3 Tax=Escherichia coli TaxID=562 RepID=UPI0010AC536F|nr:phage tail tape measure protein [Escherichia coli]TJE30799.1 phage tail tape measure protein [Escherichia coli]TJE46375.1 phage tail tape measure protein [Escherichia coli]